MPDEALTLIRAAASHPLMGPDSLIDSAATGGTTTTCVDTNLITEANDQSPRGRWLYFWSGSNAGEERYISSVAMGTGTLTFGRALSNAVASGDNYLLFRDFRWSDWLRFANDVARSVSYDREVYLRGQTGLLRYTLPTPLSQPGWIEAAFVGEYPFAFSTDFELPRKVSWHRLNPLNIQGDTYLLLEAALSASDQIVFQARIPYLHPHLSAYTMTRSVLVPFGESVAISIPRNVGVAGMVWRALVTKERQLTGAARDIWRINREEAARTYAEQLRGMGVWAAGKDVGYSVVW